MKSQSAFASAGRVAYRLRSSFSASMNMEELEAFMEAVPSRTCRPSDVIGREVPGREPFMA
jgi:hypothetical protein